MIGAGSPFDTGKHSGKRSQSRRRQPALSSRTILASSGRGDRTPASQRKLTLSALSAFGDVVRLLSPWRLERPAEVPPLTHLQGHRG
jgi:hypothetical protein